LKNLDLDFPNDYRLQPGAPEDIRKSMSIRPS
jgi:hypothetical protein